MKTAPAVTQQQSDAEKVGEVKRAYRLVKRFTRGQRRTFLMALVVLIFEAATSVFEAYPLAYLIDYLRGDKPALDVPVFGSGLVGTVAVLTIAMVLIAMMNSAADSLGEIFLARGGQTLGYELRVALFGHLQRLSLAYHDQRRTGDVITRVTGDVKEVEEFVTDSVSDLVGSVFLLLGVIGFLLFNSWQVTLVGVLMIPVLAFVSNFFSQRIRKAAKKQRAREGDLASTTQEMLTSIRVVQTFGRTRRAERRFAKESGQAMTAGLDTARLEAWFSWIWSVLKALAMGTVVWVGLFVVGQDALSLGILVMCVRLIDEMFKPTRKIIKEWNKIGKLFASVEQIAEVLDREPTVKDEPGAVPAPRLKGRVEFREVSFAYKLDPEDADEATGVGSHHRRALTNFSFKVEPGEVVALVGHSGAGKTTVAQLLPRLYDPQEGEVLLDGQDVRKFTLATLRDQISVVLQETVLFSGSVADNIAYGREGATREEVVDAAKRANADEFIEEMPDGYDTELSERASNLSGGQRQRIAIARALIRDTPILILDEPTTGLDAESTDVVLSGLRTLMRGKSTLLISHDLGLIRSADRMLVLRAGEIEQRGTHEQLMRQGGLYAQLYAKQFQEPETPSAEKEEELVDPLQSPELAHELPGLKTALDGDAMRELLQDALIGSGGGRPVIESCVPGKVEMSNSLLRLGEALSRDLPGEGCLIRYSLEIALRDGRKQRFQVGGRLFTNHEAAEDFVRTRLVPLAEQIHGREDVALFDATVASLAEPPMAVYVFPIDAELPTLITATDDHHMLTIFKAMTEETLGNGQSLEDCKIEVAHYPRRYRCLLRYELQGRDARGEASTRVLYGKVSSTEAGIPSINSLEMSSGDVLSALYEHFSSDKAPDGLMVPRFLGVRPELSLTLVESIPGSPQISRLIKERAQGVDEVGSGVSLDDAIDASGNVLAAVHESSLIPEAIRTLQIDLEELDPGLRSLESVAPTLAENLQEWTSVVKAAASSVQLSAVPCHGDYTHSQVVFDENGRSGLLDFDTVCLAEPALDLGNFCAYLRLACRKAERAFSPVRPFADELCERFVRTYVERRGLSLERNGLAKRVAAHQAASLIRITLRSWRQVKAERTSAALSVLQEQMEWFQAPVR
jgi:ABC-type multidrug transport system fused ATPase/permease subunit